MVRMIGAMPALAIRRQRRHDVLQHDEHAKSRPSTLTIDANLAHLGLHTPLRSPRVTPYTSPVHSTHQLSPKISPKGLTKPVRELRVCKKKRYRGPQNALKETCLNGYLFGCISLLRLSVLSILVGIILLVVGLVQLAPGASFKLNTYAFIGSGLGMLSFGFAILIILCTCQTKSTDARKGNTTHAVAKKKNVKQKRKLNCHEREQQIHVETVEGAIATLNGAGAPKRMSCHPADAHPPSTDCHIINELRTKSSDSNATPAHVK